MLRKKSRMDKIEYNNKDDTDTMLIFERTGVSVYVPI